ncbi:MAG: HEAT repeat domain-containing protein, partial [Planctomycetes bacterium]|nr:HEAT repeat domain-containing protein [Planctomycetota bacterium]
MDIRYRIWTGLLAGAVVAILSGSVRAQAPAVPAAPGEDETPSFEMAKPNAPGVDAILATNPRTPAERVRAANILADLERPDLARPFLKQVIDAVSGLDEAGQSAALVGLEERFGSTVFTEMASRADLAPEARQLNEAVLSAVRRHVQDPTRLAGFVDQLKDPSAEVRYAAVVQLQRAGSAAVGPLVAVLADASRAAEHANVRAALGQLGSDALDPLIAILESANAKLVVEAIRVLGDLGNDRAVVFLLAPSVSNESDPAVRQAAEAALVRLAGRVSSSEVAVRLLTRRVEEYFERRCAMKEDVDGQVQVWTWDDGSKQLAEKSMLADDASLLFAARLARETHSVAPDNEQIRRLYLAALLEQAAYEKGLDAPLELIEGTPGGRVAEFGVAVVEDLLRYALKSGHAPVATAAARILGREGNSETLLCRQARAGPLARATCDADRRVRLAAVEAILQLKPPQAFAGSSRVMGTLTYLASSGGAPRALVAGPRTAESQRVGGYLVALGYELD